MRLANLDGRAVVVTDAGGIDLAQASGGALPAGLPQVYQRWDEVLAWWTRHGSTAGPATADLGDPSRLGPPSPEPRQVFAIALNYRPHAAEAGFVPPAQPLVFTKFPSCITGPVTTVALPPGKVDWEVELVAVIGRDTHEVAADRAWDHIAGLTVGQDLSERVVQLAGQPAQFSLGKSFPGFGPTGPYLTTRDELHDADDLGIACHLDGVSMQSARTKDMIFPIADLLSRLSRSCRLLPGDLIFTGTPGGVGNRMDPPRYLRPGEVLRSTIEGLGELVTTFEEQG